MPKAPPPARGRQSVWSALGRVASARGGETTLSPQRTHAPCDGRGGGSWGNHGFPHGSSAALREPLPAGAVVEDHGVLAGLKHDLEIAPRHRLVGPPAVEYAPLFPHEGDGLMVDLPRRPVEVRFDASRARFVQSSRGTKSARVSGIRDHGATSTTVQTEPEPVLARTWRRPSLRRLRSSAPAARSSSWRPVDSVSSTSSRESASTGAGSSASRGASAIRMRSPSV